MNWMIWQKLHRPEGSDKTPPFIWVGYNPNGGNPALLVDDGQPFLNRMDVVIQCVEATDGEIDAAISLCGKGHGATRILAAYDWDGNPV